MKLLASVFLGRLCRLDDIVIVDLSKSLLFSIQKRYILLEYMIVLFLYIFQMCNIVRLTAPDLPFVVPRQQ